MKSSISIKEIMVKVVIGMLICSFAIWGLGSQMLNNVRDDHSWIIKVANHNYYEKDLEPFINQAKRSGMSEDDAFHKGLESMITSALFEQEAKRLNIIVDDSMIIRELGKTGSFRGPDKKFDKEKFFATLKSAGIDSRTFMNRLRSQIAGTQVGDVFNAVTSIMPQELSRAMIGATYSARKAAVFEISDSDIVSFDEDVNLLNAYYRDNIAQFTKQEERDVSYSVITMDSLLKGDENFAVSDEEVQEEYQKRRSLLIEPEKRRLEQIVFKTEKDAQDGHEKLAKGLLFDDVRKEHGIKMEYSHIIKKFENMGADDPVSMSVFAISLGDITKPIETALGWHIFRVNAIYPEYVKPLSKVRDGIVSDIKASKKYDLFSDKLEIIRNAGVSNISDFAKEHGVTVENATIRLSDSNENGKKVHEYAAFVNAAFDLPLNEVSGLIPVFGMDNTYAVLSVDKIRSSYAPSFESVKDDVAKHYHDAERKKIAKNLLISLQEVFRAGKYDEIMKFIKNNDIGKSCEFMKKIFSIVKQDTAANDNVVTSAENLDRKSSDKYEKNEARELSAEELRIIVKAIKNARDISVGRLESLPEKVDLSMIVKIFDSEVGEATDIVRSQDGYGFARLNDVDYPNKAENAAMMQKFSGPMLSLYHGIMVKEYIDRLKKDLDLRINNKMVGRVSSGAE